MPSGPIVRPSTSSARDTRAFVRQGAIFVAIGLTLYGAIYAVSEHLIGMHARRNRFYMVNTAPYGRYDHVILGASHAATFDYEDMNARLERMTGSRILNLSVVGGGVVVNRVLLEYFLAGHQTTDVVYVVDSFTFYSRQWNEDRLQDTRLFHRAPFDPVLARVLLRTPGARLAALDYVTGFSKINNAERFAPDVSDDETSRFNRSYRAIKQLDEQRMAYLYPERDVAAAVATRTYYLAKLDDLIRAGLSRGLRFTIVKPPIPGRIYAQLPDEPQFDQALAAIVERSGVRFYDFSHAIADERLFYDTDHLNREGVLMFFERDFKDVVAGWK